MHGSNIRGKCTGIFSVSFRTGRGMTRGGNKKVEQFHVINTFVSGLI